jgi:hypothetical protein
LKSGDLSEELKRYVFATIFDLSDYFKENFANLKGGII